MSLSLPKYLELIEDTGVQFTEGAYSIFERGSRNFELKIE